MKYWHDLITEKSWKLLQRLKGKFKFILIGGWAVYLLARTQKSKDVDVIVDVNTLQRLKNGYDLRKNDALRKYEIKMDEIDVDIYVPYYSQLAIPVEKVGSLKIEGFDVAKPEELLILKQGAELDREHSEKGEKDRIDIMSLLLNCEVDWKRYRRILKENIKGNRLEGLITGLLSLVRGFNDYEHFDMLPSEFKKKKQKLLDEVRRL
ncbi:hypothetical protein HYV85_00875 [Candidatus Woesearchaeota archaeon]|nr:hypothetical protein [Candidatus Woesearchaeota archaeon]